MLSKKTENHSVPSTSWDLKPGFTLLELMVVIGIVAILFSLLIPALKGARNSAKSTVCLSNYKKMGTTFLSYAIDYNGNLPKWNWWGTAWSHVMYRSPSHQKSYPFSGSPDVRVVVQGYVPDNYDFRDWQCPFVEGDPIGKKDSTGQYADLLSTFGNPMKSNDFGQGSVAYWFSTTYTNYGQGNLAENIYMWPFRFGGLGGDDFMATGFPAKVINGKPGLVMLQDAFWSAPYNGAGQLVINHQLDGGGEPIPGVVVKDNSAYTTAPSLRTMQRNRGLGATLFFYDGSARFVPYKEMKSVDGGRPAGYWAWSILPQ